MKKFVLSIALSACSFASAFAADLVVQEFGGAGTYSSINSAVSAAVDGDRIVIVNRPGGLSWNEDVTVTKSLQFVSSQNGVNFLVKGNYTITPNSAGKSIALIGMENIAGGIFNNVNSPSGARTRIEVIGCKLLSGNINFADYNNYYTNIVGSELLNGTVYNRVGKVIGNRVNAGSGSYAIIISNDVVSTNDTCLVIGNKLTATSGIYSNNSTQFLHIQNNYIVARVGVELAASKIATSTGRNLITNNSISQTATNGTSYGIFLGGNYMIDIFNNAIRDNTAQTTYGIIQNVAGTNPIISHNLVGGQDLPLSGFTQNGTNVVASFTMDAEGKPSSGATDIGNPSVFYNDLNLSRNDAGAYGGSYTLDNYFPATTTNGSPRVYMIRMPRAIFQGANIRIEADGYDK